MQEIDGAVKTISFSFHNALLRFRSLSREHNTLKTLVNNAEENRILQCLLGD